MATENEGNHGNRDVIEFFVSFLREGMEAETMDCSNVERMEGYRRLRNWDAQIFSRDFLTFTPIAAFGFWGIVGGALLYAFPDHYD